MILVFILLAAVFAHADLDAKTTDFLAKKLGVILLECPGISKETTIILEKPKNATEEYIDPAMITDSLKKHLPLQVSETGLMAKPQISQVVLEKGGVRSTAYTLTLGLYEGDKKVCEKAWSKKIVEKRKPKA